MNPMPGGAVAARAPRDGVASANAKLLRSARAGDQAGCEKALSNGASLGARNKAGNTALSLAIKSERSVVATWLAGKMAPKELSLLDAGDVSALEYAVEKGDLAMVRLLASLGADVEAVSATSGITTLMACARVESAEVVHALLESGANPLARDHSGYSALLWAIKEDNEGAARMLAPVSDLTAHGEMSSPLMMACEGGSLNIAKILLNERTAAEVDSEGRSPLARAIEAGMGDEIELIDMLLPYTNLWAQDKAGRTCLSILASDLTLDNEDAAIAAGRMADAMMASKEPEEPRKLVGLSLAVGMARGGVNDCVAAALGLRLDAALERMLLGASIATAAKSAKSRRRI